MLLRARSSRLFRFHRWYDRHMYRPLFWYTARDLHAGSVHICVPDRLSHIEHCINLSNARITATLTASERSDGRQRCRWCCENTQGVSQAADAAEESVEELMGAGQDYEAQILKGVEDATDHRVKPVPNHGD